MPELPEVEVVRRGMDEHVLGRSISAVDVLHPRAIRRHEPGAGDFTARLVGRQVVAAARRGKYFWLALGDGMENEGYALLIHLGMSGQLLVRGEHAVDEPHLRVRLSFADHGPQLRFVDQRTFGGFAIGELVSTELAEVPAQVAHLGPDPFETGFNLDAAVAGMKRRRTEIKRVLLDQTVVSGIGNIYADEALWRARLHGARPVDKLTRPVLRRLLEHVVEVMADALEQGGTSFDALYVNINGESGYFDRSLAVYGREGQPCLRCGATIRREPFMNRSSYTCPRCQPRPRAR